MRIGKHKFDEALKRAFGSDSAGLRKRALFRSAFGGDLEEAGSEMGISDKEFERGLSRLEKSKRRLGLESKDIEALKRALKK